MSRRDLFPASHSLTLLAMIGSNAAAAICLPALCWVTIPVAAIAMTGALSVVHEASHATYFSSRTANRVVGRVFALLILVNFSLYRRDHMLHHAHFGTERDTEDQKHFNSVRELAVALLWNDHAVAHWQRSFRAAFVSESSCVVRRDAWSLFATIVVMASASVVWPIPMTLAFLLPILASLFLDNAVSLPEHALIGEEIEGGVFLTRTIIAPRWIEFLIYYVNHHQTHHNEAQVSVAKRPRSANDALRGASYIQFYGRAFRTLAAERLPDRREGSKDSNSQPNAPWQTWH